MEKIQVVDAGIVSLQRIRKVMAIKKTSQDAQLADITKALSVLVAQSNPIENWGVRDLLVALNSDNEDTRDRALDALKAKGKTWVVVRMKPRSTKWMVLVPDTLEAYKYSERQGGVFNETEWGEEFYTVMSLDKLFNVQYAYSPWTGKELVPSSNWLRVDEGIRILPLVARLKFPQLLGSWTVDEIAMLSELKRADDLNDLVSDERWGQIVRWMKRNNEDQDEIIAKAKKLLYQPWKPSDFSVGVFQSPVTKLDLSRVPANLVMGPQVGRFYRLVESSFGDDDWPKLGALVMTLPGDYGNNALPSSITGYRDNMGTFAFELVTFCGRHGATRKLVEALNDLKPNVNWMSAFI